MILRRELDGWFDTHGVRPVIAGEFEDSALLKVFGQAGAGFFAVPTVIEDEVVRHASRARSNHFHNFGGHSAASQAATGGHSIKAIQAQLGHQSPQSTHQYAHLGQRAQLRLVQDLEPSSRPHVNVRSTSGETAS